MARVKREWFFSFRRVGYRADDMYHQPGTETAGMDDTDLRESFNYFDADNDGRIDLAEFGQLCRALGGEIADEHRDVGFREIDIDASGSIEFGEFVKWWRNQL